MKLRCLVLFIFVFNFSQAQTDTNQIRSDYFRDTTNFTRNKFWGNTTYIAQHITFARNREYGISIGRSFVEQSIGLRGMGALYSSSWGVGYNYSEVTKAKHVVNIFYEHSIFPNIILFNHTLRAEYIYNISNKQNYIRPSIGMCLFHLDVVYNYSFLLNGNKSENIYKHAITARIKLFANFKNRQVVTTRYRHNYNRNITQNQHAL